MMALSPCHSFDEKSFRRDGFAVRRNVLDANTCVTAVQKADAFRRRLL